MIRVEQAVADIFRAAIELGGTLSGEHGIGTMKAPFIKNELGPVGLDMMKILDDKMQKIKAANAHTIVTTNPGCLLQMKLGVKREGLEDEVRAVHLVELLSEAGPVN